MTTIKEERITVIPFDGTKVNWKLWSTKFMARARRKGYKEILTGNTKVPYDDKTGLSDAEIKLKELNTIAYEDLVLLIDGSKPTGRVVF